MSNRNKPIKYDEKEKQAMEDEKYFQGRPTRAEVMSYVNGLLENHYMPTIMSSFQLGMIVMQAILINKGICTGEEIQQVTEEFVSRHAQESKKSEDTEQSDKTVNE